MVFSSRLWLEQRSFRQFSIFTRFCIPVWMWISSQNNVVWTSNFLKKIRTNVAFKTLCCRVDEVWDSFFIKLCFLLSLSFTEFTPLSHSIKPKFINQIRQAFIYVCLRVFPSTVIVHTFLNIMQSFYMWQLWRAEKTPLCESWWWNLYKMIMAKMALQVLHAEHNGSETVSCEVLWHLVIVLLISWWLFVTVCCTSHEH